MRTEIATFGYKDRHADNPKYTYIFKTFLLKENIKLKNSYICGPQWSGILVKEIPCYAMPGES